jgi:hypothetical protein
MAKVKPEAGLGTGPAGVLDAVDVVWEVEAEGRGGGGGLPGLLPAEGSLLVAGQPLLPGVVHPHHHQVLHAGQRQHVGEGRAMAAVIQCLSVSSVADPGCLSRILIFTHPGSGIQRQQQKRGVKKTFVVIPFYVATNFTKLKIILVLKCEEKNLGQFSKNYSTFYPKNCH